MSAIIGRQIAAAGQISLSYGEAMLKDVRADQFARHAPGREGTLVKSNHPAWVFGHLALYNPRCLELMGLPAGPAAKPAGWDDLFRNGTECRDDPAGTIYPRMDAIAKHWADGMRAVLAALPGVPDEVFTRANPGEGRMKELLPTVGAMVTFLMTGHPMSHLGQVSAWRRFMGLGSAM